MKHFFSAQGAAALAASMVRRPLLAFDFDGTLAPIVPLPGDARVSAAVTRRLDCLGRRLPLAIISGRSVQDIRERLAFEPHFVIGNHGAEDPLAPARSARVAAFDTLRERLIRHRPELHAAGVLVEDKQHSLALHYRLAHDRNHAFRLVSTMVSGLGPDVRAYGGKMVVNVVDAQAPDKAQALASLVAHCGATDAIFVGDDINDEPVFARAGPSWLTVRVGRDDPDTQAKFCLDSIGEVADMLDRMLALAGSPLI